MNNNEYRHIFCFTLLSLITAVLQVPESSWGDLSAGHHTAQKLIFTWVGKRTKYKPERAASNQVPVTGWFGVGVDKAWSLLSAHGRGCPGVIPFYINSYTLQWWKTFFPLSVTVLAPWTESHHPSVPLAHPKNRYWFYRKWKRTHQNNSCSALPSRTLIFRYSLWALQFKSILGLTPGKVLQLFPDTCAPITKLYEIDTIQKEK